LQELAKRELARRRLLDFVKYNFPEYRVNWHHIEIIQMLERIERGELNRLMILMPPRHGKSELASIQFPAWFIGRNPDKQIIQASYSGDLAVGFGRQVRNLISSEEYQNIFSLKLAEDSQAKGRWNTDGRGSYNAMGVGGATTGKGADVLIIDDPLKNRQDADSPVIRDNIWDWYRSTARTRLSPTGAIILIMTRWHDDDLAGRILTQGGQWEILKFPAIATQDEKFRKQGEPLWADYFTLENLNLTQKDLGRYEWSALYQQEPIDEASQEFKKIWFRKRTWAEVERLNTRKFLTIDTAISKQASADYTGICQNFIDTENIWNLKAKRMKINPTELIDLVFNLQEKNHFEKIGIEKTIYLDTLQPFLEAEMRKRNKYLPIVELHHNQQSKPLRIRGLIPRYEYNGVFHIENECNDLEEELLRFPNAVHDDVADAAAYQIQLAPNLNVVRKESFISKELRKSTEFGIMNKSRFNYKE